jgi:predicted transcriptional regulator
MTDKTVELTGAIVAAYVNGNSLDVAKLPTLIQTVFAALQSPEPAPAAEENAAEMPTKAQIRKSIGEDKLISFVDGKAYATLKRHLTKHGMTVAEYRQRYGLPSDYPTTAPAYSAKRSAMAKSLGLGAAGRSASRAAAAAPAAPAKAARKPRSKAALAA